MKEEVRFPFGLVLECGEQGPRWSFFGVEFPGCIDQEVVDYFNPSSDHQVEEERVREIIEHRRHRAEQCAWSGHRQNAGPAELADRESAWHGVFAVYNLYILVYEEAARDALMAVVKAAESRAYEEYPDCDMCELD